MIFPHRKLIKPPVGQRPYRGHRLSKGLVGLWLMNEGSGNIVQDLSGNGNTGTFTGDVNWVPGKFGPCLDFPGSTDRVDFGDRDYISSSLPFSVSFWMNTDAFDATLDTMLSIRMTAGHSWIAAIYDNVSYKDILFGHDSNSGVRTSFPGTIVGNWYHIVFTYNGSGMGVSGVGNTTNQQCYINGVKVTLTDSQNLSITANKNWMGELANGGSDYNGKLDNLSIYNRALSASEVSKLYREPFCMFDRDEIVLWQSGGVPPVGNAGIMTCNTGYWGATY